jgi:hypothetical protein
MSGLLSRLIPARLRSLRERWWRSRAPVRDIPLDRILMGGEGGMRALAYARLTSDLMRPSTPVAEGPHVRLLREYERVGEALLEPERFVGTAYYANARDCLRIFGDYYPYIFEPAAIRLAALRFVRQFRGGDCSDLPSTGHTAAGEPIEVYPISGSACFELAEGNHRCAFAVLAGQAVIRARVLPGSQRTPLLELLQSVTWDSGQEELYQPLPLPELAGRWTLIRRCTDRFERMHGFLQAAGLDPAAAGPVLDLGAYFGWFVSRFAAAGYDATGVERDRNAIRVGELVYGNTQGRMIWDDAAVHLRERAGPAGVVSCLSVMHHFLLGRNRIDARAFLHLLDAGTSRVLFLEMGEEHEEWFRASLAGWNAESIKRWVLENSGFVEAVELGRDSDDVLKHRGNFRRMLFAFLKPGARRT